MGGESVNSQVQQQEQQNQQQGEQYAAQQQAAAQAALAKYEAANKPPVGAAAITPPSFGIAAAPTMGGGQWTGGQMTSPAAAPQGNGSPAPAAQPGQQPGQMAGQQPGQTQIPPALRQQIAQILSKQQMPGQARPL